MIRPLFRAVLPATLLLSSALGQGDGSPKYIIDWLPMPDTPKGLFDDLHDRLGKLVDTVVRYTSPDIPRESRRLWRISLDGQDACIVTTDVGVHLPRWGRAGYVLYLVEADTNGDGRIDSLDEYLVRMAPASGGAGKTVGQGKSAVWSPDGESIAILHGGRLDFVNLSGETIANAARPGGQIVLSNSLNPEVARDFWAVDAKKGSRTSLPSDLQRKYLWLGMLSPSGAMVVFSNAMRKNIVILETGKSEGQNLVDNGALNLEPTWSPDERYIAYVSTKSGGRECGT